MRQKTDNKSTKGAHDALFGVLSDTYTAPKLQFQGTPEQLVAAMERPWTKSLSVPKVETANKTQNKKRKVKKFDRNTDGMTEAELARAKAKGHITNVVEVPTSIRQRYISELDRLTKDIADFLITDVAPFESALDAAVEDAGQMIRLISGAQQAEFSLGRSEAIIRRLSELRTIDWICTRLKMPQDIRSMVLLEYMGPTNDKRNAIKELLELHKDNGLSRPSQRSRPRMQQAQVRTVSRSTMDARTRGKTKP